MSSTPGRGFGRNAVIILVLRTFFLSSSFQGEVYLFPSCGHRIAGRVTADEGRGADRGADFEDGLGDRVDAAALDRHKERRAVESAIGHRDNVGEIGNSSDRRRVP